MFNCDLHETFELFNRSLNLPFGQTGMVCLAGYATCWALSSSQKGKFLLIKSNLSISVILTFYIPCDELSLLPSPMFINVFVQ